nr:hypothetical protein [uncultured Acetatifactor sp.]
MRIRAGMRRMTTNMLSSSRRRAGLSARKSPFLSTLQNKKGLSGLALLNANSVQSARLARSSYDNLQRSSKSLAEELSLLGEKVDLGGKDITATASNMVGDYNDTMKYLKQISGVLNDYYRQTLKETVTGSKEELEEIGITVGTDGSLSLNKGKLAEADEEKVKKLLGASSDFVKRINAVASRVSDNAKANMESASSRYNASGGLSNSYFSRYNFRG